MARKPSSAARQPGTTKAQPPAQPDPQFGQGSVNKTDSDYRRAMVAAIAHMPGHPRRQGVEMQAHHLISGKAIKMLSPGVRKNLEYFNYNINTTKNLVYLPYTLQGACHLGVQPHRGDHSAKVSQDMFDDDSDVPDTYHKKVRNRLSELAPLINKSCPGDCSKAELSKLVEKVGDRLNGVSLMTLQMIQNIPPEAPLTKLYQYFQPGHSVGCAGVDSVNGHGKNHEDHAKHRCGVGRNHLKNQRVGQDKENILYVSDGKYQLKVGQ